MSNEGLSTKISPLNCISHHLTRGSKQLFLQDLQQVYQNRLEHHLTVFCIDPNDLALLFIMSIHKSSTIQVIPKLFLAQRPTKRTVTLNLRGIRQVGRKRVKMFVISQPNLQFYNQNLSKQQPFLDCMHYNPFNFRQFDKNFLPLAQSNRKLLEILQKNIDTDMTSFDAFRRKSMHFNDFLT